jgi:hypothetical protein
MRTIPCSCRLGLELFGTPTRQQFVRRPHHCRCGDLRVRANVELVGKIRDDPELNRCQIEMQATNGRSKCAAYDISRRVGNATIASCPELEFPVPDTQADR